MERDRSHTDRDLDPTDRAPEDLGRDVPLRRDEDPHHSLSNPVEDPDPTEWPDPYERRDDPRDPEDPDGQPFGEDPHPPTGSGSTSEPHPGRDPEAEPTDAPERDNLDD